MLNTYVSDVNVEIAQGHGHPRIIMGKGIRFQTTDRAVQRVLSWYPHVELISSEPETKPVKLTAAEALALYGPGPEPVRVSNTGGVQMKPLSDKWTTK